MKRKTNLDGEGHDLFRRASVSFHALRFTAVSVYSTPHQYTIPKLTVMEQPLLRFYPVQAPLSYQRWAKRARIAIHVLQLTAFSVDSTTHEKILKKFSLFCGAIPCRRASADKEEIGVHDQPVLLSKVQNVQPALIICTGFVLVSIAASTPLQ